MPSIVAARLGAYHCLCTEKQDDTTLDILTQNLEANKVLSPEGPCHVASLNWGDDVAVNQLLCGSYRGSALVSSSSSVTTLKVDFILGADILYSTEGESDIYDVIVLTSVRE